MCIITCCIILHVRASMTITTKTKINCSQWIKCFIDDSVQRKRSLISNCNITYTILITQPRHFMKLIIDVFFYSSHLNSQQINTQTCREREINSDCGVLILNVLVGRYMYIYSCCNSLLVLIWCELFNIDVIIYLTSMIFYST